MKEKLLKILGEEKWKSCVQFVKFGLVGVSNTAVTYILYALIIFLLRNCGWEQDFIFANMTSFTISVFWSFYWNNKYVFQEKEKGSRQKWKALGKCFLSYGFTGYILDNILSYIWIRQMGISRYLAPLLNLIFSVPVNFLLNKLWAFRDEPASHETISKRRNETIPRERRS